MTTKISVANLQGRHLLTRGLDERPSKIQPHLFAIGRHVSGVKNTQAMPINFVTAS